MISGRTRKRSAGTCSLSKEKNDWMCRKRSCWM
jgi:hypothetical protein